MRMDCYPDQDTLQPQGGFKMSIIYCHHEDCPDLKKYNTLIYTITCNQCYENKMVIQYGEYWREEE